VTLSQKIKALKIIILLNWTVYCVSKSW